MPTEKIQTLEKGIVVSYEYDPHEMPEYWLADDRYIRDAKRMDDGCVVVVCGLNDAKIIAAHFVNAFFAIPTCTYFDGVKLSLCCEYAGARWKDLKESTQAFVDEYKKRFP